VRRGGGVCRELLAPDFGLDAGEVDHRGTNCAAGGNEVISGLDSNHNRVLDPSELTSRSYVCNAGNGSSGSTGATGMMSLVDIVPMERGWWLSYVRHL
jgi:hypothetical protein